MSLKEFIKLAKEEFSKYGNQYSFLAFFLWGIALTLFSSSNNLFLRGLFFLLLHALAVTPFYIGILKNSEGKRSILGILLGILTILFTLLIDGLSLFSS